MTADGRGVCSHVGSRLLADVAAAAGVAEAFDDAVGGGGKRRSAHAPGRVLADLAVMLADGGVAIGDLAVLRDQPGLFGPVASTATAWRVLAAVDESLLGAGEGRPGRPRGNGPGCCAARPAGRVPAVRCAGTVVPGLVIDLDATLVTCHSENRGGGDVQARVWLSPAARLAGQHRRGAGGDAAAGEREREHRRRPHPA